MSYVLLRLCSRAVAAATDRRFKSCHSDWIFMHQKINLFAHLAICGLVIAFALISPGQSPAPANLAAQLAATPTPSPSVPVEPPSLIPPNILPPPGTGSLPQIPGAPEL